MEIIMTKESKKIIKLAVSDFFGSETTVKRLPIMKYLTKRNKPKLTEEQKDAIWFIRQNLGDKVYRQSLLSALKEKQIS